MQDIFRFQSTKCRSGPVWGISSCIGKHILVWALAKINFTEMSMSDRTCLRNKTYFKECRLLAYDAIWLSKERIACIIRVTRIGVLETTLAVTSDSFCQRCSWLTVSFHSDDGGDTFLRNVSPFESHTTSHP
jgi:hypothetical protein